MTNLKELERIAIERLKAFEPRDGNGYYLGYSGGKDSDVILALAKLAGVKFHAVHNHTTVDAPETVYYVRKMREDPENHLTIDYPDTTMWRLIVEHKCLPTRRMRFCCEELKERGGIGELCVFGVRRAESARRSKQSGIVKIIGKPVDTKSKVEEYGAEYLETKQGGIILNVDDDPARRVAEHCYRTRKTMINPIVDWSDVDVWDFIKHYDIEANPLYKEGYYRVGCVGCPMSSRKKQEFERYPKYKDNYLKAIDRMLAARRESDMKPVEVWGGEKASAESVFAWWIEDEHYGQISMWEEENGVSNTG